MTMETARRDEASASLVRRALAALDRAVGVAMRGVATACLAALFLLLFVNVVSRSLQLAGLAWFDEVVQGLFAWMVFTGAAALWREGLHFRVDLLQQTLPPRARAALRATVSALSLAFMTAMAVYGLDLTLRSRALTPILNLPTALFYASMPLAGAVMAVYSLRELVSSARALIRRREESA